jgi:hypothetical protein
MYNIAESNSRLVYPCTPYEEVIHHYPVDMFLYADNYEDSKENLHLFSDYHEMIQVAEEGKRKAKGTTGEVGLVSSYFANPFGPVQEKEKTHQLVFKTFKALAAQGTQTWRHLYQTGDSRPRAKRPSRSREEFLRMDEEKLKGEGIYD